MKLLAYLILVGCLFSQESVDAYKRYSSTVLGNGRANSGIGSHNGNEMNTMNSATWNKSDRTIFHLNMSSGFNEYQNADATKQIGFNQLENFSWISSMIDSTLAFGITTAPIYQKNSLFIKTTSSEITSPIKKDTINGSITTDQKNAVNLFRFGLSYRFKPQLSFGLEALYFQGSGVTNEFVEFVDVLTNSQNRKKEKISSYGGTIGLSAHYDISPEFSVGLTFRPEATLTSELTVLESDNSTNTTNSSAGADLVIPSEIGFGLHYEFDFGHLFSDFRYNTNSVTDDGSYFISAGLQTRPVTNVFESVFKRSTYSFGTYYYTEDIKVNASEIATYGVTASMSIPFNYGLNNFELGVSYGQRGDLSSNKFTENTFRFNVGVSIGDFWYMPESQE